MKNSVLIRTMVNIKQELGINGYLERYLYLGECGTFGYANLKICRSRIDIC